ncbi:uncharacterized protein LOC111449880 [Cucurbita moschata]|uniref:Uncharacterized protein LOC111449880 n=1 Tax=Cucurbita moschata TaxID=3662 RepID=A0A6J1G1T8_CUCMO|nr:uncharacterized protein LOC111449880 [Cucurbita moschata]
MENIETVLSSSIVAVFFAAFVVAGTMWYDTADSPRRLGLPSPFTCAPLPFPVLRFDLCVNLIEARWINWPLDLFQILSVHLKCSPPVASKELKHFKDSVQDSSRKASKSGRPPSKKLKDRKASAHMELTCRSSDITGTILTSDGKNKGRNGFERAEKPWNRYIIVIPSR